ncbi:MAG: polysaccharide deacetylase family protein [Candidatus Sulfotelmatobacter sp.]|jgi:peptidoglycan/xylan/chitin deacetylase (PgdA/CDA1 family)
MKKIALGLMKTCGVFGLTRVMSAKMARILMYHNFSGPGETGTDAVSATALRAQLAHLRRHFHVVPLTRIFELLKTGRPLDPLTVALTIDDGRSNCYEFLFPLLSEFEMPATFFVVSSFIRGEGWVWTDKVLWLAEQPSRPSELSASNIELLFTTLNRLRPEVRTAFIENMAAKMGVSIPETAPEKYAPCSWNELREMADSGLVDIGSHTVTHPILASITDEESWHELTVSRAQIEEGLDRPVVSFCFPNGKPVDYRHSQLQQVKDAGYAGAVVADFGMITSRTNPYELPRIGVSGCSDALSFSKDLDGAEYYQTRLLRSLRLRSDRRATMKPPSV